MSRKPRPHLGRVVLHYCFSHAAWEVYPAIQELFGPA